MRTARLIVYLLLLIDLGIFAWYRKLLHATEWWVEKVLLFFVFTSLAYVLLFFLYELFTFRFSDPAKRKSRPLLITVTALGVFAWLNPFGWPVGHRLKLAGWWYGKPTTGKIELYEDGLFEIRWNGVARDGLYHGRWAQRSDTVFLQYIGKKLDRVGDTLLIGKDEIIPLNGYSDWVLREVEFKIVKDPEQEKNNR